MIIFPSCIFYRKMVGSILLVPKGRESLGRRHGAWRMTTRNDSHGSLSDSHRRIQLSSSSSSFESQSQFLWWGTRGEDPLNFVLGRFNIIIAIFRFTIILFAHHPWEIEWASTSSFVPLFFHSDVSKIHSGVLPARPSFVVRDAAPKIIRPYRRKKG